MGTAMRQLGQSFGESLHQPGSTGWTGTVPSTSGREPRGTGVDEFAGEVFLALADSGRFVVDVDHADRLIADLELTLAILHGRLLVLDHWQRQPARSVDDLPPEVAACVVDVLFTSQLAPGRLERAIEELPKYVAALKVARANATRDWE